jgi:hypothetical protein
MRILGLVLVAWVLSACASGPADPSLDAEAKLFRAPADKACIYVVPSPRTQAVTITMDGRKVGTLAKENYLRLDVAPGRHVLGVTRAIPVPAFFRTTHDDVTVNAEADRCYFLRAAWTDSGETWREFRLYLDSMTDEEGRRAVNVLWRALP